MGLLLTCATLPALDGRTRAAIRLLYHLLILRTAPDILWSGRSILKGAPFQETDLKDLRYVSQVCFLRSLALLL